MRRPPNPPLPETQGSGSPQALLPNLRVPAYARRLMSTTRDTRSEKTTLGGQGTASASGDEVTTLALTIVYHPSVERVGQRAVLPSLTPGQRAPLSRTEPLFAPPGTAAGEALGDEHVSRRPLYLESLEGGGARLVLGESGTSVLVRGARLREAMSFSEEEVNAGVVLELGSRVVLLLHPLTALRRVLDGASAESLSQELVGASEGVSRVLWEIHSVADGLFPVLLRGETGAGKELVARAIHRASPRRDQPFVAVNLAAITPSLAIAELFGSERGAFSGATKDRIGYFEQAAGGTLFLDEVGEAPIELQGALLRVLETSEVHKVGARTAQKLDIRIVSATDADLEVRVASGSFRAPLFERLATYQILVPPLRERRDDIGVLLFAFLRRELGELGEEHRLKPPSPGAKPWLPSAIVARLAEYDWPGNVRQLRNVARQLVIGNRGRDRVELTPVVERLLAEPLPVPPPRNPSEVKATSTTSSSIPPKPHPIVDPATDDGAAREPPPKAGRRPSDVSEAEFGAALRACRWDFAAAAQTLGISRGSVYMLIKRYPRFRKAGDLTAAEITASFYAHGGDIARMADHLQVSERALTRRVRELGLS